MNSMQKQKRSQIFCKPQLLLIKKPSDEKMYLIQVTLTIPESQGKVRDPVNSNLAQVRLITKNLTMLLHYQIHEMIS